MRERVILIKKGTICTFTPTEGYDGENFIKRNKGAKVKPLSDVKDRTTVSIERVDGRSFSENDTGGFDKKSSANFDELKPIAQQEVKSKRKERRLVI